MTLVLPIPHFDWQVLRAVKRTRKPAVGRALRLVPTRRTKDGSFLAALVRRGLLAYATGGETAPFEATYTLTPMGEHAAEYGECETEFVPRTAPKSAPLPKAPGKPGRPQKSRTPA